MGASEKELEVKEAQKAGSAPRENIVESGGCRGLCRSSVVMPHSIPEWPLLLWHLVACCAKGNSSKPNMPTGRFWGLPLAHSSCPPGVHSERPLDTHTPTMMPGTPLLRKLLTGFSPDVESSLRAHSGSARAAARRVR